MKADNFIKKATCRRIEWNLKEVQECRASLWRRKKEEEVTDKRVLVLIRKFLKSGVMINGVVVDTEAGSGCVFGSSGRKSEQERS